MQSGNRQKEQGGKQAKVWTVTFVSLLRLRQRGWWNGSCNGFACDSRGCGYRVHV